MKITRRLHFIIVTLIAVFALALIGFIVAWYAKGETSQAIVQRYSLQEAFVALQVAEKAKADIATSHSFLGVLAQMPDILTGETDDCNSKLRSTMKIVPGHIDRITRINANGIITCSTEENLVGLNATIFDHGVQKIINDPDHNPHMGELTIPPGGNEYAIGYFFPLRDASGAFIGALKSTTNVSTIREQYEKNPAFQYTGKPFLIDDSGDILYASAPQLLNLNIFSEEVASEAIDQSTLQHVVRLAGKEGSGSLSYLEESHPYFATYRRVDILPGHWWALLFATDVQQIEATFLKSNYSFILTLAGGHFFLVVIVLIFYILYITRRLIRPEATISTKHEAHMKKNISEINQAFGKVAQKLGKLEQHIEHDINALHNEAEKK